MRRLHKVFLLLIFLSVFNLASGQDIKLPGLDPSPADIAILRESRNADPHAKIIYSRPQKKGRVTIAADNGALAPFGKLWRTGANETTELIVYKNIKLGDVDIAPGTYSLYTIPGEKEWTIILNGKLNTWGHFAYDESQDKYKISGTVKTYEPVVEAFTIVFGNVSGSKSTLYLAWDTTIVEIPVEL